MGRSASLAVSMMAIWLLWSGHYTPLIISFGVLSCLLVVFIARRMYLADPEGHPIHLLPRLLLYIPWLSWAIFRANLDVALRILRPDLPIVLGLCAAPLLILSLALHIRWLFYLFLLVAGGSAAITKLIYFPQPVGRSVGNARRRGLVGAVVVA